MKSNFLFSISLREPVYGHQPSPEHQWCVKLVAVHMEVLPKYQAVICCLRVR